MSVGEDIEKKFDPDFLIPVKLVMTFLFENRFANFALKPVTEANNESC